MAEKKKEKKKEKKSKLKKFIGPVTVTPRVSKQTGVDGKIKTDDQGGGLTVDTKFGTFGINKNTNTQSMDGFDDLKTKTKDFTYGKDFNIGKNTKLSVSANKGKSKNSSGKSKTKGGTISISKTFNSGGLVRTGKPKLAMKGWK
jgi:hypothetical protein|tara:strand:- start:47 stop:478 length:432 start_codon:yes stop_codon:yes gene_type:complete